MATEVRPLLFRPHPLKGLSRRLLISHPGSNHGRALPRLNAIGARPRTLDWATAPVFDINNIEREELIAAGSVIPYEIYFDAPGGDGGHPPAGPRLGKALVHDFGDRTVPPDSTTYES
jgi:Fe-Mn family superoxide dismutase